MLRGKLITLCYGLLQPGAQVKNSCQWAFFDRLGARENNKKCSNCKARTKNAGSHVAFAVYGLTISALPR